MWDPVQYQRYDDERSRPFFDLLAQVDAPGARHVVDLGCGPGNLTATLLDRWPDAHVLGVDNSAEMLAAAVEHTVPGRLGFELCDVRDFRPPAGLDVIVSNAALQWVPDHLALLPVLAASLAPGGVLAFQVPANFDSPAHRLLAETAARPRWHGRAGAALATRPGVAEPGEYLSALSDAGLRTTVWETTYIQVLSGDHAVLEWMRGTALRPVLAALQADAEEETGEFLAEYGAALDAAYPAGPQGTVLPFRRIFAVGTRPANVSTPRTPAASSRPASTRPASTRAGDQRHGSVVGLDHAQLAMPAGGEEAARRFYERLIGLAEVPKPPTLAGRGGCWFAGPGTAVHLGVDPDFRPARKAHVALAVDDLDALASRLAAAGVPTTADETLAPRRHCYVDDPFGNRIELIEP